MRKLAWAIAIVFSANAFASQAYADSPSSVVRHILKDAVRLHKKGLPPPPPGHDAPPPPRHHDAPPHPRGMNHYAPKSHQPSGKNRATRRLF